MIRVLVMLVAAVMSGDLVAIVSATPVSHTAVRRPAPRAGVSASALVNVRSARIRAEIRRASRTLFPRTPIHRRTSSTPAPVAAAPAPAHRELLDVTAYCATGSRTASGVWPHAGQAAGNRWPFGTRIRVPGVGVVTITDRIGWGSDLDLYFGDRSDCDAAASAWGRQRLAVEVLS